MEVEKAPDVQKLTEQIIEILKLGPVFDARIICMRSYKSKARACARIWSLPKIWRVALEINPFYVIEVLSENFDSLSKVNKTKVIIHELLHIPKKFSGGLVPHNSRGIKITQRTVDKIYEEFEDKLIEISP